MLMRQVHKRGVLNRLKITRRHLDAVIRMTEAEAYCPEMMKQLAAVQGSLERASPIVLRKHLETCVAAAMVAGRTDEIHRRAGGCASLRSDRYRPGPELALTAEGMS